MPIQPKKPCRHPGCPNLTYDKYCEVHASVDRRASAHERGYTSKWRRLSKLYLKAHPLCEECKRQGKLTPATVVDHIVPHRGNEHLRWSESNWQSLCKPCHDKKTGTTTQVYKYTVKPNKGDGDLEIIPYQLFNNDFGNNLLQSYLPSQLAVQENSLLLIDRYFYYFSL